MCVYNPPKHPTASVLDLVPLLNLTPPLLSSLTANDTVTFFDKKFKPFPNCHSYPDSSMMCSGLPFSKKINAFSVG